MHLRAGLEKHVFSEGRPVVLILRLQDASSQAFLSDVRVSNDSILSFRCLSGSVEEPLVKNHEED